jgi:hypothetical protein
MNVDGSVDVATLRKKPGLLNDASFTPQITRRPPTKQTGPAPKLNAIKRDKFSSTATMFIDGDNSCLAPRVGDILQCVSIALHNGLLLNGNGPIGPQLGDPIWSETIHSMGAKHDLTKIPSIELISQFLTAIWDGQRLSAECAVMTIAYVDRFLTLTSIKINPVNWRRIVLASAIVASKVWEDLAVWNADFLVIFPNLDVTDLNCLEREMLAALEFVVSLKASLYCKYYFDLRSLCGETALPERALSQEACKNLEAKTHQLEEDFRNERFSLQKRMSKSEGTLIDPDSAKIIAEKKAKMVSEPK